jgi:hypothetical protein
VTPLWDLRLGDCLDPVTGLASLDRWALGQGVDDKNITHVITDPPYSEHVHSCSRRGAIEVEPGTGRSAFNRNRDLGFDALTGHVRAAVAAQFGRLIARWCLVFCDIESSGDWSLALEDSTACTSSRSSSTAAVPEVENRACIRRRSRKRSWKR